MKDLKVFLERRQWVEVVGLSSISHIPVRASPKYVLATEVLLLGGVILNPLCSIFVYLNADGAKGPFTGCCDRGGSGTEEATMAQLDS